MNAGLDCDEVQETGQARVMLWVFLGCLGVFVLVGGVICIRLLQAPPPAEQTSGLAPLAPPAPPPFPQGGNPTLEAHASAAFNDRVRRPAEPVELVDLLQATPAWFTADESKLSKSDLDQLIFDRRDWLKDQQEGKVVRVTATVEWIDFSRPQGPIVIQAAARLGTPAYYACSIEADFPVREKKVLETYLRGSPIVFLGTIRSVKMKKEDKRTCSVTVVMVQCEVEKAKEGTPP